MNNLSISFFFLQDEKAINPKVRLNTSCTLHVFSCVKIQAFHSIDLFGWEEPSSLWASQIDKRSSTHPRGPWRPLGFKLHLLFNPNILYYSVGSCGLAPGAGRWQRSRGCVLAVCCQGTKESQGNPLHIACAFSTLNPILKSYISLSFICMCFNFWRK